MINWLSTKIGKEKGYDPIKVTPKADLHQKKVMLSIWWDWKRILSYVLLPSNKTVNSDVYCEPIEKFKQEIEKKRPELVNWRGVVFHYDNARPHTSLKTQEKLRARLRCFTASIMFLRSYSFRLPPFQILGTSFSKKKFRIRGGLKN